MIEGSLVGPVVVANATTISSTATIKAKSSPPTHWFGGTGGFDGNLELVDAQIYDTTAITGDNTNRYSVQLCKGTVAAPIVIAYHDFVLASDLAADTPVHMDLDGNAQSGSTTLSAAITTTTATSVSITSSASFPQTGKFWIKVDDEIMYVTAGAGTTTLTVTRGQEGTKASTHANAATVVMFITATGRRVTGSDVLHAVITKNGSASNLTANFQVTLWFSNMYQYAAQSYPY